MEETKTYLGKWWFPGDDHNTISGTLTIRPNGEAVLETIGLIGDASESPFSQPTSYSVIWGITSEAKPVSLFHCITASTTNFSSDFSIGKYTPRVVAIGKHFSSWDDKGNYDVYVHVDALNFWLRPHCISETFRDNKIFFIVNIKDEHPITVPIDNSTNIVLSGETNFSSNDGLQQNSISQSTTLNFEHSLPISMQDAKKELVMFEQFLSFATLSNVQHNRFLLIDKDVVPEEKNNKIEIFEEHDRCSQNRKTFNYLFEYDAIKDSFPRIIQKWYSEKDMIIIRKQLVQSLSGSSFYTSELFLMIIQALDGWYSRFRKDNLQFKQWLQKLKDEFVDIDKIDELLDSDIDKIKDSRDYYSHLLPDGKKSNVANDKELYTLMFKLRKLLLCCLLNVVGLTNNEISDLFRKSSSPFLRKISQS